jgi:hypothetical protein
LSIILFLYVYLILILILIIIIIYTHVCVYIYIYTHQKCLLHNSCVIIVQETKRYGVSPTWDPAGETHPCLLNPVQQLHESCIYIHTQAHSYTHKNTYIYIQTHHYNNSTYIYYIMNNIYLFNYLTCSYYKVKNEVIRAYTSRA